MPLLKRRQVALCPLPPGLEDGTVPPDTEVFQLKATGEIFLDYESYAQRMRFYLEKTFSCELTGKSGLDFFDALESERRESMRTQNAFPNPLKPRVLQSCQFHVEGRLEGVVDHVFDRYDKRWFMNEQVLVDDPSSPNPSYKQQYGAIVRRVLPAAHILQREIENPASPIWLPVGSGPLGAAELAAIAAFPPSVDEAGVPLTSLIRVGEHEFHPVQIDRIAHRDVVNLDIPQIEADTMDLPSSYTYQVQLMQGNLFNGAIFEVDGVKMQRDRLMWNKALLRKYLKETLYRDPAVGSPWQVRPRWVEEYSISTQVSEAALKRSADLRDDMLHRRKKGKVDYTETPDDASPPVQGGSAAQSYFPAANGAASPGLAAGPSSAANGKKSSTSPMPVAGPSARPIKAAPVPINPPRVKHLKYPIEDLELDPTTVFDGRILNRKHMALPDLPKKPMPSRDLPVATEHFERFMACWNFLNVFGQALQISPFTLDDFTNALAHSDVEPRCNLLGEIHAVLTNNIAAEGFTVAGTTKASVDAIPHLAASYADDDGMTVQQRQRWVIAALNYSRGWDKRARPRAADGRKGWDLHMLGILTHKGGLETVPSLPTIFKHLFTDDDFVDEPESTMQVYKAEGEDDSMMVDGDQADNKDEQKPNVSDVKPEESMIEDGDEQPAADTVEKDEKPVATDKLAEADASMLGDETMASKHEGDAENAEEPDEAKDEDEDEDEIASVEPLSARSAFYRGWSKAQFYGTTSPDPEARYLSLSLEHKLDLLSFLCDMNLGSKAVKKYMDDCELRLTEERKIRADIKKERKDLLTERTLLNKAAAEAAKAAGLAVPNAGSPAPGSKGANGETVSANATPLLAPSRALGDEDMTSLSIAPSERDESVMDEAGPSSRRPSSSPISELAPESDAVVPPKPDITNGDAVDEDRDELAAEVGSQVDELESSSADEAEAAAAAAAAAAKKKSPKGKKKEKEKPVDRKVQVNIDLEMNAKKEDLFERDFRRHREVSRISPLGKDRFYQKYWWFDGVGPQSLVAPNGRVIYGTGRLFVQGPSAEDWQKACDEFGGEEAVLARRKHEEGYDDSLGIDQWASYEDEQHIEQLVAWLNMKGLRELATRNSILKWKRYIVEGAKSRQSDLLQGLEAETNGTVLRTTRQQGKAVFEQSPTTHYLAYENTLAQK